MNALIKVVKEPINLMLTSKFNSLLNQKVLDILLDKFAIANEQIIEKYFNKIFPEIFKNISNLYDNHVV